MLYLIIKSLHLIGVVGWFAGLFYIFRLYVYHVENKDKAEVCVVLSVMERRLYLFITTPAMVFTLVMGTFLVVQNPTLLRAGWFHAKLFFLLALFAYHFFAGQVQKRFLAGDFFLTGKQCRLINEVPTLVLVVVIFLAVIKPF